MKKGYFSPRHTPAQHTVPAKQKHVANKNRRTATTARNNDSHIERLK